MRDEAFLSKQFRAKCTQEIGEHCTGRKTKYDIGYVLFLKTTKFSFEFQSRCYSVSC